MSTESDWSPRVRRVGGSGGEARVKYAASLMREERFDDARDELLAILQEDDKSIQARMMLGAVYLRQKMYTDALDQFKSVTMIDPLMAQAQVLAGTCCLRLNDFEQAEALIQAALDLDPKLANAHVGMAQVLSQTGQTQQAMLHLEEALRLDPQLAQARMLLAKLLSDSGNVDQAIGELTAFLNTNPDHAAASVRLAMMEGRKGNHKKAVVLLESALKGNSQTGRVWDLLGRMKMELKDYKGAETAFTEAIDLKLEDRSAPLRLVDALIKQGKLDQARDRLKSVPRSGRMTTLVHRAYGDIYAAMQLYDDAVQSYGAAILNTPEGEGLMAEIDAAAGPDSDNKAKIPHFLTAFAKLKEKLKEEGDRPNRGGFGAGRRGGGGGGGGGGARGGGGRPNRFRGS